MAEQHLAQLNIARLRAPIDSPVLADFVARLAEINGLGERSPGYVWRLQDESGDATAFRPFEPDVAVNLTVWESVEALRAFVYRSAHLEPMRRRRDWFLPFDGPYLVLWWIPAGTLPTLEEAGERLALLRRIGPSAGAFTLREPFPATEVV
jgi:heme-degrading monooxygenase HmoA